MTPGEAKTRLQAAVELARSEPPPVPPDFSLLTTEEMREMLRLADSAGYRAGAAADLWDLDALSIEQLLRLRALAKKARGIEALFTAGTSGRL